jgi:hypothetical protein
MPPMADNYYSTHGERLHGDLTPYSAVCSPQYLSPPAYTTRILSDLSGQVSSFNLPIHYDHTLNTPVPITQSITKSSLSLSRDMDINLSPTSLSPCYDQDGLRVGERYSHDNSQMKLRDPGTLRISTADRYSPQQSPLVPSTPYFGMFGVSETFASSRSETSHSINQSPEMQPLQSAGGMSNNSAPNSVRTPSLGSNYRQSPVLIAPTPPALRPALKQEGSHYRQKSITSQPSASTHQSSTSSTTTQKPFPKKSGPLPGRRKGKLSNRNSAAHGVIFAGDMSWEEQVLMQLTTVGRKPWKAVAIQFREKTGKSMKVPALQMRLLRLKERLRVWTPTDVPHPPFQIQFQAKL